MIINKQYEKQNTSINDEYEIFIEHLYKGEKVGETQYEEMRKAFYCGSCFILNLICGYFQKLDQDSVQRIIREQIKEIHEYRL